MQTFRHILYASTSVDASASDGLAQALNVAREHQAALTFLLLYPELPINQWQYRELYHRFFHNEVHNVLQAARATLSPSAAALPEIHVKLEAIDDPAAVVMIRHVLRDGYDLLVKEAEIKSDHKGFKALDMTLLRKCPCPVWLARPLSHTNAARRVAVAINPESRDSHEEALSLRLLVLASGLAATLNSALEVIACWDYPFENFLRHNARAAVPEDSILETVVAAQTASRTALQHLLQQAGLIAEHYRVHHLRGQADQLIPDFVALQHIDILVMGSVARSGIKGFLIGNTAVNIAEELRCSLVALKPQGFVSPISLD